MSIELHQRLNNCLTKFGAQEISDITQHYSYYPDAVKGKLGSGSYGAAYRVKSIADPSEPLRVVKIIRKDRITTNATQIHHMCAELAVLRYMRHQLLNSLVKLYHNSMFVFIVLELCEGPKPDPVTRLAHLFAHFKPSRLANIDEIVAAWTEQATAENVALDVIADRSMPAFVAEVGAKGEVPTGGDLFNYIDTIKRVPDALHRIIAKQSLTAISFLHENNVVHRDVKTENLIVSTLERKAELLREATTDGTLGRVAGVRFRERIACRLIDFGLVKYLDLNSFPTSPSPGAFERATQDPFAPDASSGGAMAPQPLAVTPCGTDLYCSLEVVQGILAGGVGRSKWTSTRLSLPKMDVYGVGCMMFCMANGRPPFRLPTAYRPVSREDRMRRLRELIAQGPQFSSRCSIEAKTIVETLMTNNADARPTADAALRLPFFTGVTDHCTYEVRTDGNLTVIEEEEDAAGAAEVDVDVMEGLRGLVEGEAEAKGKESGDEDKPNA